VVDDLALALVDTGKEAAQHRHIGPSPSCLEQVNSGSHR
jgi:hypothetical protein